MMFLGLLLLPPCCVTSFSFSPQYHGTIVAQTTTATAKTSGCGSRFRFHNTQFQLQQQPGFRQQQNQNSQGPRRSNGNNHRQQRSLLYSFDPLLLSSSTDDIELSSSTYILAAALALPPMTIDASSVAKGLGYVIGTGAVLLYTPIALRIIRQESADGLVLSTWWLKLISYTCSIVYNLDKGYPLAQYVETVVLATEATVILGLVAYYQEKMDAQLVATAVLLVVAVAIALNDSMIPPEVLALGQASAAIINVFAVLPQFALNARTQTSGDYSPITASLATLGCGIRIFTTIQLAGADPLLLASTTLALVLNGSLLLQILYYGIRLEEKSLLAVMTADYVATATTTTTSSSSKED